MLMTSTNEMTCMVQNYDLDGAVKTLLNGGLILYPTDTIWGIGCDATNAKSVDQVYDLKRRDRSKPLIILVDSIAMLRNYVAHLHPRLETLLIYHVRPLTVVYEHAINLPANLVGKDGSIAIRIVQDPYCKALISAFGRPLVSTSANISNEPFPSNFGSVSSEIIQGVDYVVKHRQHEKVNGKPSVMVKLSDKEELIFLRD